ncbi:SP_1767 family glycosyltransferase [Terrisporobacter vanillatitrophus]|uniref:SP_1767 family glycosyltransferase n=1 Tax=Terrisporobacter vanillatitrophus TaxID=3058402 RepID=UPI0033699F53
MKKVLLKIYYKLLVIKNMFIGFYNKNIVSKRYPLVKGTDETLEKIINEEISMSRYGDGELSLIKGENLKFQSYNEELAKRLREILHSNKENHIVCLPNIFEGLDEYTDTSKLYWIKYLNLNRHKIYKIIDMKKIYYNTQVTRLYIDIKDKYLVKERFKKVKSIWKNKEVLIIEGEKSRLGIGNDLFEDSKTIERIICPSINAYDKYDDILKLAIEKGRNKIILIALGPTATVLAYDLNKLGYHALDIGHIDIEYEWFLNGSIEKKPVKHKYIGEIDGGDIVEDLNDKKYVSEIICNV